MTVDAVAAFERTWRRTLVRRHAQSLAALMIFSALLWGSVVVSGLSGQGVGEDPLGRVAAFLDRLTPDLQADALFADRSAPGSLAAWYYDLPRWLAACAETLQIALLATVFGAVGGFLLSLLAARATMPFAPLRFAVRRLLEAVRTVPELILALILVAAFGVGPLAGVIAVTLGTIGSLGKLFTEVAENADARPGEAVRAAGGGWAEQIRYGLLPQIAPNLASYALIRMEVNIGSAAALGIVGAGGIGLELERAITFTQFDTYLAILLLIIAMIMICDLTSSFIRKRLIGIEVRA